MNSRTAISSTKAWKCSWHGAALCYQRLSWPTRDGCSHMHKKTSQQYVTHEAACKNNHQQTKQWWSLKKKKKKWGGRVNIIHPDEAARARNLQCTHLLSQNEVPYSRGWNRFDCLLGLSEGKAENVMSGESVRKQTHTAILLTHTSIITISTEQSKLDYFTTDIPKH